jgi:hypothetical protein
MTATTEADSKAKCADEAQRDADELRYKKDQVEVWGLHLLQIVRADPSCAHAVILVSRVK